MNRLTLLAVSLLLLALTACQPRYIANGPTPPPRVSAAPPEEPTLPLEPTPPPVLTPDEYLTLSTTLHHRVIAEAELLTRLGLYEYNWWASRIGEPGGDDLTQLLPSASSWLASNGNAGFETLSATWVGIVSDYARLSQTPLTGPVPDRLPGQVDALIAAYHQLYIAVTNPRGTASDFARMLCACTYSIDEAHGELTALLEVSLL